MEDPPQSKFQLPEIFKLQQNPAETPAKEVHTNPPWNSVFKLPDDFRIAEPEPPVVLPKIKRQTVSLEGVPNSKVDARNYRGNGHWQSHMNEPMGGKEYVGFIYVIRNVEEEKLYLGKKLYRSMGSITKNEPSNWPWYISSSKEVSAAVKKFGKQKFEFVCIHQYKNKAMLSYAETWSLMYCETPYRRDKWYNLLVNKVSWVTKEPIPELHKQRLNMMMKAAGI